MKIKTPIITLLVGLALAIVLFIASVSAVSSKKAALAAASASAAATAAPAAPAVTSSSAASTAAASGSQPASASATVTLTASASASASFVIPPHANYVGEVQGNLGAVALVVHDTFAVAYFCNGSTIEAWFSGTPQHGQLTMQAKGSSGSLTARYALGHARGTVVVNGVSYPFSIIAVHRPSGLFQSIANVRGATIKAGWIVLANGTEVGSLNPDVNAANAVSQAAPKLDLSTLTADDNGTTITAKSIDGETGSGF